MGTCNSWAHAIHGHMQFIRTHSSAVFTRTYLGGEGEALVEGVVDQGRALERRSFAARLKDALHQLDGADMAFIRCADVWW